MLTASGADNRTVVHTVVDAQARQAYRAGTLCCYRPRTFDAGRIASHVEQPCMEFIALCAVWPRFSIARETRGSHPPPPYRERQSHRRHDDVGPKCLVEPSSPNGPPGGNGGVARRDCSHVQVVICMAEGIHLGTIQTSSLSCPCDSKPVLARICPPTDASITSNSVQFAFDDKQLLAHLDPTTRVNYSPRAFIIDSEVVKPEDSDVGFNAVELFPEGWTDPRTSVSAVSGFPMSGPGEPRRYHSFGTANAFSKPTSTRSGCPLKGKYYRQTLGGGGGVPCLKRYSQPRLPVATRSTAVGATESPHRSSGYDHSVICDRLIECGLWSTSIRSVYKDGSSDEF